MIIYDHNYDESNYSLPLNYSFSLLEEQRSEHEEFYS